MRDQSEFAGRCRVLRAFLVAGTIGIWSVVVFAQNGETPTETEAASAKQASNGATRSDSQAQVNAEQKTSEHPESYFDFAMAGGYLMLPIGLFSLLWLTFFIERLTALRASRVLPLPFVRGVSGLGAGALNRGQFDNLCSSYPSSASRVLSAAKEKLTESREEIEVSVNTVAQREIFRMKRFVGVFAVIAATAPLVGLLGTVTGMIQAFREVAIQGLGSGQALAPGIYKALVTTAAGLMVAIPALLSHHWIMSRIDRYVHGIDNLVVDFVEAHRQNSGHASDKAAGPAAHLEAAER